MITHTPLQTIMLVEAVEERVGAPVEAWPTSILKILFTFDPHMPFTRDEFTKFIAFMFGNHVPLPMACFFLRLKLPSTPPRHSAILLPVRRFVPLPVSHDTIPVLWRVREYVEIHGWHRLQVGIPNTTTRCRVGSHGLPHDSPPHISTGKPAGVGGGRPDVTCTFSLIKVF